MFTIRTTAAAWLSCAALSLGGCASATDHEHALQRADASTPSAKPAIEDSATRLTLSAEPTDARGAFDVHIDFQRGTSAEGPRVVELRLRHTDNVTLRGFRPGVAVSAAAKDLVVQAREDGVFRTLIFSSSNTNDLDSGRLATLEVQRAGNGPAHLTFLVDQPLFAPQQAEVGLLVGEPLVL